MPLFSLAFLCGILALQHFSHLPSKSWVGIILLFIFIRLFFKKKLSNSIILIIGLALGFSWAILYAHHQLSWVLPETLTGKPLTLTGYIVTIPTVDPYQTTFLFSLETIKSENAIGNKTNRVHGLIHLAWQNPHPALQIGEKWQLNTSLKKVHGQMNPGGFDNETWSFVAGIRATGSVISGKTDSILLNNASYHFPIGRVREYFRDAIKKNLRPTQTSPWITALAIGERHAIPFEEWQILRNTGTNHLMAIAGLHIGLMATLAYTIFSWGWRRYEKLTLKIPAQQAGAIAALIIALIYSAMAGFSIPTQRACIMLSLFLLLLFLRRKIMPWQVWSIALFSVLLLNPLIVLTESVWLSFASVALIIYGMHGRLAPQGLWWKHGRIQWVIALGLIPLSIWLFQQCSWVSFIANSIAIPWVGFLVVPLTLSGCFLLLFSAKIGGFVLGIADKILAVLWKILTYLSHISWGSWYQTIPHISYIIMACIGMIILLVPAGFPGRYLGILWVLPLLLYKPDCPNTGDVWFTLLDVGQGLSAVVQTQHHTLVFDAGARFSENNDMGNTVVVPFLRTLGINHLDKLIISHGDNDHIGGAFAVLKQMPTYLIQSSVPARFPGTTPATYCLQGQQWEWDRVQFEFLYPPVEKLGLDNNSSCVLRITSGQRHILLTGDIEKLAEYYLVNFSSEKLAADILVAPHHGSKTSAVDEFIHDVHPSIVLFPVGYRNRYHFPTPSVLEKYHFLGVAAYDTVHAGAIQFKINARQNSISKPVLYRSEHRAYWL